MSKVEEAAKPILAPMLSRSRMPLELAELAGKIAAGKRVKGAAMNKTEAKEIVERLQAAIE